MAIINVQRNPSGTTGSRKLDKSARKYVNSYIVRAGRTDDQNQAINGVLLSEGVNLGASFFPSDPLATLIEASANLKDMTSEGNTWIVNLMYDCDVPLEVADDPLDDRVIYSGTWEQHDVPLLKDLSDDHKDILNAAFEPFDSAPTAQSSRAKLTLIKNYAWDDFDFAEFPGVLANTVNSEEWNGLPAYSCKIAGISFKHDKRNDVEFAAVTFEVVVDLDVLWHPVKVLNCGYREYYEDDGYSTILDNHGVPVGKPALLDIDGHKLNPEDEAVYLEFQMYKLDSWEDVPTAD